MARIAERTGLELEVSGTERVPPNAAGLIHALREIGYKFEQAISDLVDNSITAEASTILIRFVTRKDKVVAIAVADDGSGMDSGTLTEAMRFGAKDMQPLDSLGKYGVGLKLASFSHAKCLSVYSRQKSFTGGRRWTIDEIARDGWMCSKLKRDDCEALLDSSWGPLNLSTKGTVVEWSDIDKLRISSGGLKATLRNLKIRLERHLGLFFHRFLEGRGLRIIIDSQEQGEQANAILADVEPLNPFPEISGHSAYPSYFSFDLKKSDPIRAQAHIWPPNSKSSQYRLAGGAASKQGFYFYRNDRLIQAGGWNSLIEDEREPHGSLSRVRIDLPAEMDSYFSLNVQKAAVTPPPSYVDAVQKSTADNGHSFPKYRALAQEVYRKKDFGAVDELPLVPRGGLPKKIQELAEEVLAPDVDEFRDVGIKWKNLMSGDLVAVDKSARMIHLNRSFRPAILRGKKASERDVPLVKMLCFLLLEPYLDKNLSAKSKKRLKAINALLAECSRLGMG